MRAGFRCQRCGAAIEAKRSHNTHHRYPVNAYPELALERANMIVLCVRCHASIEARDRNESAYPCDLNGMPTDPTHPWNQLLQKGNPTRGCA
jgi:hypothetical protein